MQPLAARSPSPERAPGKEAGNAERAVNLVRTFPEVAADLASQQPPAPPPPSLLQESLPSQGEATLKVKRTRLLIGEVNWKAQEAARARKTYANKKTKAKAALDEAKRKAMLGTELESVVQQPPPQAPPAAAEDAGRAGDADDAGEDVFYWLYRQPRKRERPPDAGPECKHGDAFLQQQPRKRGRPKGKGSAGAARHACAAPSEPLPGIKQPPPQPSFQPPPSLRPLPRSDLWTIVDMYGLG